MRRASNITAFLAVAVVVLGVGGVHTAVAGTAAMLALLAAGFQAARMERDQVVLVSWVGLGLLIAATACFLQLVPVPPIVHTLLNPTGLALYERGLELAGIDSPGWRPLSLDPAQTADRAIRYVALATMAIWAANVRSRRAWRRFGAYFLPIAGFSFGIGLLLSSPATSGAFDFYTPSVGFRGPSTFVSTNHGGVFFGLTALIAGACALGLRREKPSQAAVLGAAALVATVVALAHDSDGVFLALGITGIAAAVIKWRRLGVRPVVGTEVKIGLSLLLLLTAVAAWWLDLHHMAWVFAERVVLSGEHGGRMELLTAGTAASADYWRFGAGAGAVGSVLPAYIDWTRLLAASIPVIENDPLELILSFGAPLAALMFLAAATQIWALRKEMTDGLRNPRYAVAAVSALYLALVAQVHFPLFALGISIPSIVWLELLWSRRNRPTDGKRVFASGHVAVGSRATLAALSLMVVLVLASAQAHVRWLPDPAAQLDAELVHEIWRRPAAHEAYVHLARNAARRGELDKALALANFAVEREPSARVRLYRAHVLAAMDQERAAQAYGELFAEGYTTGRPMESFVKNVHDTELRARTLDPHPGVWADAAERMRRIDGPDAASSFVVALASRHPGDPAVYVLAATTYLRLGQPVLSHLWAELVSSAEAADTATEHQAPALLARALQAAGRTDEALAVLDAAIDAPLVTRDVYQLALRLRGAPDTARLAAVERHHARFCAPPIPPADLHLCWSAEAWLEETRGDFGAARQTLSRLLRRLGDPLPLAMLYYRAGRCDQLEAMAKGLEPGNQRGQLEALVGKCH